MAAAPLIVAAGSSLLAAASTERQSSLESSQAEVAASQQDLQVTQREADRKDRLANSLATQNALAGAKGIAAFEGSPLTILEDSIERERVATERDVFSTELNNLAMRSTAKSRRRASQIGNVASLAQRGSQLSQIGTSSKAKGA